jgi:hypothetical protein
LLEVCLGGEKRPATVYQVVFHQDQWRIRYENLLMGAFETAEAAAQAALTIARSASLLIRTRRYLPI